MSKGLAAAGRAGVGVLLLAGALGAAAQQPLDPSRRDRPDLPQFLPERPQLEFQLPPAPLEPGRRLSGPLRLTVARFRFTGVTAFAIKDLEALLAPYTGRQIGAEELEEARLAVTRHYIAAGYVNSGALIPDQQIAEGTVLMQVVEGRLTAIEVGGKNDFRPDYLKDRMALAAGTPLNVQALQEQMQIMLQNPQIERINAALGAGEKPGDALLRMDVTEAKKYSLGMIVANDRSPAVGGWRTEVNGAARNYFGRGEVVGLRIGEGKGIDDLTASLVVPVSARDTLLSIKYENIDLRVVEPPFDVLEIENRSENLEIGLRHPFYRTVSRELAAGATLVRRRNSSALLGQPFSFVPGLTDGKSVVSVLRLAGDWSERSAEQVIAARLTYSYGLDAFGSTVSDTGDPDSRFRAWLLQSQWVRRLGRAGYLVTRADGQAASEPLLPSEKFSVGGLTSVRGYRETALLFDSGYAGSLEYRLEVARYAPFAETAGPTDGAIEIALFGDAGGGRDRRGGDLRNISSLGFGLRWQPWRGALAQFYKGYAANNLTFPRHDPQDSGLHFLFQMQFDF